MLRKIIALFILMVLTACIPLGPTPGGPAAPAVTDTAGATDSPTDETPATVEPTATIEATAPPLPATEAPPSATPEDAPEKILILSPGPGSRLTSPLTVSGEADPTFEQNLVVRLMDLEGNELAFTSTTIQADLGQRGPFEAELAFTVSGEVQAVLQVYSTSARDGGITHLSSVIVNLADSGPEDIRATSYTDEWIRIDTPANGAELSPGMVLVEGFGLPSFEGSLIIELLDEDGIVIAVLPIIVAQPDIGLPGPFSAQIELPPGHAGPGRVVVRDESVAYAGDSHLASVEVTFVEP